MFKYFRIGIVTFVVLFCTALRAWAVEPMKKEAAAKDFSLKDLSGQVYTLQGYKDRQPVALVFWNMDCSICRDELMSLNIIYPELQKEGIEVLAIDVGDPIFAVRYYVQKRGLLMKVLLDRDAAVARQYYVMGVPTYILINKKGNVVFEGYRFPRSRYKDLFSK
jgi:peroxiredoxin